MRHMSNFSDTVLIIKYRQWCDKRGMNRAERARVAGKSRQWGTLLEQGKIGRLNLDTRLRIRSVLGMNGDEA